MNATHDTPQFTPAQILEAARRAETEGRADYALQFYRHLSTSYPGSLEAANAEAALMRLAPGAAPQANGLPLANPFDTAPGRDYGQAAPASGAPPSWQPSAAAEPSQRPHVELPPPVGDYLIGRILARLMTWSGVLLFLASLGVLPVAVLMPRSLAALPLLGTLFASPTDALKATAVGLALAMAGQVIRALLDQANATRDIAAVMRAGGTRRQSGSGRRARH